jgi:nucleoside 2-deoxyribosyltransferase
MRAYLAGPDVFLPDPEARAAALKEICARHGLIGVSPLDLLHGEPAEWQDLPLAMVIARRNEAHIASCDVLIANLTPFRGPSADVGTAYEMGFMRALGRKVFGWSNSDHNFTERSIEFAGKAVPRDGQWRDAAGMLIEAFGLVDNLMLDAAVQTSGGRIFTAAIPAEKRWIDLRAFECAVEFVASSGATWPASG